VGDYTFGTVSSAQTSGSSMLTSLTPALPTGTAAGDVLFLFAKGRNTVDPTWTVPSGWTEMGSRVSGSTGIGGAQYNAMQLWRKTAGASESAPTVNLSSGAGSGFGRGWDTYILRYVPSSPSVEFDLVTACVDYSAAATFTGETLSVGRTATTVAFVAMIGATGTTPASNAQGFTRRVISSPIPFGSWYDKDTTAGSVSLPDFATPVYTYIAKVFAFDRTVPVGEWGVDQVRW
jgi:hypothetical protein